MEHVRRIYVAGVGYTCYLTESLSFSGQSLNSKIKIANSGSSGVTNSQNNNTGSSIQVKKEISVANYTTFVQTVTSKKDTLVNYKLNLKNEYYI